MCGIAGVFLKGQEDAEPQLRRLLGKIAHRGKSPFEIDVGNRWALGANRLAIVDRDNGRQPCRNADGRIRAVLNGEIYNHDSLRQELIALGFPFLTGTDTEVLAHGYECWGASLFERLDGMFAVVIYDGRSGTFVAARDPLGVKPLYFVANDSGTYFSSEIKALLGISGTVEQVKPRHFMSSDGQASYGPCREKEANRNSLAKNSVRLRQFLSDAVRKRVDTDLPVAVLLSAGIDSAAVMYEASRLHPDVTGFSVGRSDSPDVTAGRRLCSELKLSHHHIDVSAHQLLEVIPEVIWTIESFEPNHIRGGALSYVLSREIAARGYRIALCGEGADELFGGYPEPAIALLAGEKASAIIQMLDIFMRDLHRTQLQRIDRTGMRFALEVREPFLDRDIVEFANGLPLSHKMIVRGNHLTENKRVLRHAYRGILPDWVVDRTKAVLSLGAGFGSNGPEGLFYEYAEKNLNAAEYRALREEFPDFALRNREEAFYFKMFMARFGELPLAAYRPVVNASTVQV